MNANTSPRSTVRTTRSDRGFTLVEIMVVVVILGMLATLVAPAVLGQSDKAKVKAAQTAMKQLHSAAQMYYLEQNRIPTMEDLITPDEKGQSYLEGDYESAPKDPWGNEFQIFQLEGTNKFAVFSNGPDGIEETEDDLRSDKKQ